MEESDGQIEQPRSPSAGLTPHPSFVNLFEKSGENLNLPPLSPPGPFEDNLDSDQGSSYTILLFTRTVSLSELETHTTFELLHVASQLQMESWAFAEKGK